MEFRGPDPFACGISNPTPIDQSRVGTSGRFRPPMRPLFHGREGRLLAGVDFVSFGQSDGAVSTSTGR